MSKITQYVRHLAVVAIASLLAQCAWAYNVGDDITFSNTNYVDQAGITSNGGSYSNLPICIPASDDLPVGSVVTLKSIKLGLRSGNNASANVYLAISLASQNQGGSQYRASNQRTTTTEAEFGGVKALVYETYSRDMVVGTQYIGYFRTGDGTASGYTENLQAITKQPNCDVIKLSTGADSWMPLYEVVVTVKTLPATKTVTSTTPLMSDINSGYTAESGLVVVTVPAATMVTVDEAPVTSFSIKSEGDVTIVGSADHALTAADVSKIALTAVTGTRKFVFPSVPDGLAAPAAGTTYRFESQTALSGLPLNTVAVPGTVEVAAPIANQTLAEYRYRQNVVFDESFSLTAEKIQLGNQNSDTVEVFTQKGGSITATAVFDRDASTMDDTANTPLLFAHWPSTVTYNLLGGTLTAENGTVGFGRDGSITMIVGGGESAATFKALGISNDNRGQWNRTGLLKISQNGTVQLGARGIYMGTSDKKIVLDGGTLEAYDTCTVNDPDNAIEIAKTSTIKVAADKTMTISTSSFTGSGHLVKTGAGTLAVGTNRPTMDVQEGKVKITLTTDELAAGQLVLTVPEGATAASTDKVEIVSAAGETVEVSSAVIDGTTITLKLQVNAAITTGGNLSELIGSMTGEIIVQGDNDAENPIIVNIDSIPEGVTEVLLSGTVQIAGMLSEKVKFDTGATIITTDDRTIANTSSGANFRVDAGTLKMTGTSPAMITVNEGATFDVNGVADVHYPITLNGGTLKNGGAAIQIGKQQWKSVTLTADSFVETDTEFGMIAGSYGAITFQTNGHKLTKKGTGNYILANVTFANGGALEVLEGSIEIAKGTAVTTATPITGTGIVRLSGGSSVDLGSAKSNITEHFVSVDGTGTLKWTGTGSASICSNDSLESPFITVNPNTTFNIYGHDYSGWHGGLTEHGWIKNNGTLVFQSESGTRFFREHLVIANGAVTKIDHAATPLLLYGGAGTADKCQIMLPTGAATISAGTEGDNAFLHLGNNSSGGYGDNDNAKKGIGVSVGENATLTIDVPVKGNSNDPITKWGAGTLKFNKAMNQLGATIQLKEGSVAIHSDCNLAEGKVVCANANKKLAEPTTDGDYTVYSLVQRDAGEVTATSFSFDTFKIGDQIVELLTGDTVVVPANCDGDAWHPTLDNLAGHAVKINKSMNWKTAVGQMTIGADVKAFLWNYATIPAGANIEGDGILVIGDSTPVTGAATINTTIYFGEENTANTVLMLANASATLTCAELPAGKVISGVSGKVVDYTEGVYSLIDAPPAELTFTLGTIPEHIVTTVYVGTQIVDATTGSFKATVGDRVTISYTYEEGYVGEKIPTVQFTVADGMTTTLPDVEATPLKTVAYAFAGSVDNPTYKEYTSLADAIAATGVIQAGIFESVSENVTIPEGAAIMLSTDVPGATLSPADETMYTVEVKGGLMIDGLTINGKVGLTTESAMVVVMNGTTAPTMETTVEGKKIVSDTTTIEGATTYKLADDIPPAPTATVEEITVEGVEGAHTFTAVEPTTAQAAYYGDWNADFIVTFSRAMAKGEVTLTGQSDHHSTEWVDLDVGAVAANTGIPLIAAVLEQTGWTGVQVTYDFICETVGTFNCGVKNNLAVGAEAATMTVQLVLSKGSETLPIGDPIEYTLTAPTAPTRPTEVEGGSTDQKSAYDKWAKEAGDLSGLTNAQIIDRFIFNVDADTPDEDLEDALDEVIEKTDCFAELMAEIAKGNDPTAYTFTLEVYPNATFKFVEVPETEITTSAKLFRLTATFVPVIVK